MAPKEWDEENDSSSTPPSSPPPIVRRTQFDDEEEDSDVIDSWDAEEDSEVEREKAKKAAEAKAKAEAAAKAAKKSKKTRIEDRIAEKRRKAEAADESSDDDDDEDEATKRERTRRQQKEADLAHAMDLFETMGVGNRGPGTRGTSKAVTAVADPSNPASTIELSSLKVFKPETINQFKAMRETLEPLITANAKKGPYLSFLQEFVKQLAKDLPSEQIKKVASGLTTLSNEKMKEEKAAEKGGKKSKAAKTKTSLNATRDVTKSADLEAYDDDGLGDDDFM